MESKASPSDSNPIYAIPVEGFGNTLNLFWFFETSLNPVIPPLSVWRIIPLLPQIQPWYWSTKAVSFLAYNVLQVWYVTVPYSIVY